MFGYYNCHINGDVRLRGDERYGTPMDTMATAKLSFGHYCDSLIPKSPSVAINWTSSEVRFHRCCSKFNADIWAPYTDDFYGDHRWILSVDVRRNLLFKQSSSLLFSLIQNPPTIQAHCSYRPEHLDAVSISP